MAIEYAKKNQLLCSKIRKLCNKHLYIRIYVAIRYPDCRLDWVGPEMAMLTSPDGDMWLIRDRKPADWWMQLAVKLIPGSICVGGGWLLGVMAAQIAAEFM